MSNITLIAEYDNHDDLHMNIFKMTSLQNNVYTCDATSQKNQIVVYQLTDDSQFVKLEPKTMPGQVIDLCSNGVSLYAVIQGGQKHFDNFEV